MTNLQLKETVSKPQNKDFHSQFLTSSNVTKIIGYFGQVVSGLTEFHLFFTSLGGSYNPFWITSNILPLLGGLFAIYIFEYLGVRVYLVRIIRQIVNKDFGSWERVVLFCFNMLFVLALCGANLVSSWLGQNMTFASKTNVTTTDKTHGLELEKTAKIEAIQKRYNKQLEQLTTTYQTDKTELKNRYDTDIKELKNSRYTHRENKSKYDSYTAKIDNKLASKQTDLSDLKKQFDTDKQDLKATFESDKNNVVTAYDARINGIYQTTVSNVNLWATVQKFTLPILIGFILLSWFAIVYNEIFIKGSGQKIEIKEVEKRPLLIVDLLKGLYDGIYYFFYWITSFIVGDKKVIYNQFRQHEINYNQTYIFGNKDKVNKPKIAAQTGRLIGFNRNKDNNQNNGSDNQQQPTNYPINNHIENPINYPTNNHKGEVLPTDLVNNNFSPGTSSNVQRYTVDLNGSDNQQKATTKSNIKPCKNCGKHFTYKHWNAKYCSDKCRIESWEKRTGTTLKKKSKKH